MSNDIRTTLKERSLKKINRSLAYTERLEATAEYHSEQVKAMVLGESLPSSLSSNAITLRTLYYSMLEDYKGSSYAQAGPPSKRAEALWRRVEAACERSECPPKKFMRAQFDWFDKTFGRAPDLVQLTTDAAIDRAREFSGNVERRVVGVQKAEVSMADIFRQSEKLLRDMMRAQKYTDREKFYQDFVLTEIFTFPPAFLKADPAYRNAVSNG